MGKKNPIQTPRSKVRAAIRQVWLRSRERAAAIKRDNYTCQCCGRKQSKAKGKEFAVQVHHKELIVNWEAVIDAVYEHILCHPDGLETLCRECHDKEHQRTEIEVEVVG
jgi:5-methylcytosine-specific restriction endonuclease McrA